MNWSQQAGLIVIGAGQAGSELALSAHRNGWESSIVLLGDECELPYHRPPLSKAYFCGQTGPETLELRPREAYEAAGVTLKLGVGLRRIDRAARCIELGDASVLPYAKLALCTGGRARPLECEGLDPRRSPDNLHYLRSRTDADRIRAALRPGCRLVVIGGGYIGLEVAASARSLGVAVTVLEAQPRVLARAVGTELSAFYEQVHAAYGVAIHTGVQVDAVCQVGSSITSVHCADGRQFDADLVIAGLGMIPNIEAAAEAGLASEQGIAVDAFSVTCDPDVVAAGDCTIQQSTLNESAMRLESVSNALEQARAAAAWICGKEKPNRAVPWFWSDQYDLKLQMAGLSQGYDRCIVRGDLSARSFYALYTRGTRLLAIEAINRPAEFMQVRRALAEPVYFDPEQLVDDARPLRELLAAAGSRT
jgi:3-phenylpropionate/trans-cinnamate dioxygenase ferredoxin reductase subunit